MYPTHVVDYFGDVMTMFSGGGVIVLVVEECEGHFIAMGLVAPHVDQLCSYVRVLVTNLREIFVKVNNKYLQFKPISRQYIVQHGI